MFLTTQKLNFLILEGVTDSTISSPAILQMKQALMHLYDIDDVQERNDVGLNKSDKDAVRSMYSQFSDDSPEATPETIARGMNILRRYKNTQFLGYSDLEKEIDKVLGDKLDDAENSKIIVDYTKSEYGKILVTFPIEITPRSAQMKQIKEIMLDPNSKVLVMSMKMGGTGISFPNTFSNMIVNDYDWTPESAEQSEGRIYRINTTQDVNIQYVIANGSDTQLFDRVKQKRQLAEIIQKYRAEYINTIEGSELLKKLVAAQKEYKKIDSDIINIVSNAIGSHISESFAQYFYTKLAIEEYLIQPEKSEY